MAKITIDKLIKRLLEDKKFAKEFKTLSDKCTRDRDNLIEKGVKDPAAARRFLSSLGQFHKKFAFDPMSLAALMVPTKRSAASYTCPTETQAYDLLTGTESARLLVYGKSRQSKPPAKSTRTYVSTKKSTKKK